MEELYAQEAIKAPYWGLLCEVSECLKKEKKK